MSVFHWHFLCSLSTHYIWHNIGIISQLFLWWIFAKKRALKYSRKEKCSQQILFLPFNYDCWYGSVDLCFVHSAHCDDYWSWELSQPFWISISSKVVACLSCLLCDSMASAISRTEDLLLWILLVSFYLLPAGKGGWAGSALCSLHQSEAEGTQQTLQALDVRGL